MRIIIQFYRWMTQIYIIRFSPVATKKRPSGENSNQTTHSLNLQQ